jgi:hypothetical protein
VSSNSHAQRLRDSLGAKSRISPLQRRVEHNFNKHKDCNSDSSESVSLMKATVIEDFRPAKFITGAESEVEKQIKSLMVTHNSAYSVFLKSPENLKLF